MINLSKILGVLIICIIFVSSCSKNNEELIVNEDLTEAFEFKTISDEISNENMENKVSFCNCLPIGAVAILHLDNTSLTISWTAIPCGTYLISKMNLDEGTHEWVTGITSPTHTFENLDPGTEYEISVYHVGTGGYRGCIGTPAKISFSTPFCFSEGDNSDFVSIDYIILSDVDDNIYTDNYPYVAPLGYLDHTDETLSVPLGADAEGVSIGLCFNGTWSGIIYLRLWIDDNDNGVFDADELYLNSSRSKSWNGSPSCYSGIPFDFGDAEFPSVTVCGVRARLSISLDIAPSPCGDIQDGQVLDFTVNVGSC